MTSATYVTFHKLACDIEVFIRKHGMAASLFGRPARHDPRFVLDLRMGRQPRRETELAVRAWMEEYSHNPKAIPGTRQLR